MALRASPYRYLSAGSANQDSKVASATGGALCSVVCVNTTSNLLYLKLYDKATAPTSADTPIQTYAVPANGGAGSGFVLSLPNSMIFTNGLAFRMTQNAADNDATACSANDLILSMTLV